MRTSEHESSGVDGAGRSSDLTKFSYRRFLFDLLARHGSVRSLGACTLETDLHLPVSSLSSVDDPNPARIMVFSGRGVNISVRLSRAISAFRVSAVSFP
ncbi:hypothetical protein Mapa_010172 [Marchantia paleacea]|nr:hypothetical protein Mapa_010172 [Marchantia paleacea]